MGTKKSDKSLALLEKISGESLSLGRFLWAIREGEEWTQVDFAKKLGISRQDEWVVLILAPRTRAAAAIRCH